MKTEGRPQEIIAAAVRRGETIDRVFLSWLWQDFQQLQAEHERLLKRLTIIEDQVRGIGDEFSILSHADLFAPWPMTDEANG